MFSDDLDIVNRRILIDRKALDQRGLNERFQFEPPQKSRSNFRKNSREKNQFCAKFWRVLLSVVPILEWLPKYQWKRDFPSDLSAGIAVAVMHIPQGNKYYLKTRKKSFIS